MRVAGYQPQYFPRLHYFARILNVDTFKISDYLQFVQSHNYPQPDGTQIRGKSYQAHAPVKSQEGIFYLTLPIHNKIKPITQTAIDYTHRWADKHIKSIQINYAKAPNFAKFFPEIEKILNKKYDNLADLNIKTVLWGIVRLLTDKPLDIEKLNIETVNNLLQKENPFRLRKVVTMSKTPVPPPVKGGANDWIIKCLRYLGADELYYGGTAHTAYMDLEKFKKAGIKTVVQEWKCAPYSQRFNSSFLPNLSIIDLVMNENLKKRQGVILG
jgi:hypothetical protein